MPMEEINIIKH